MLSKSSSVHSRSINSLTPVTPNAKSRCTTLFGVRLDCQVKLTGFTNNVYSNEKQQEWRSR